jgi:nucleoside-diphosphate-sugar epimerase
LYRIPATGLRFFTVYGPWGRPDMAMFIFAKAILDATPIKLFNHGKKRRDFTYIDGVSEAVVRLWIVRRTAIRSGPVTSPTREQRRALEDLQRRQQPSRRTRACGFTAGERVRPERGQGDVADAARSRIGNLLRAQSMPDGVASCLPFALFGSGTGASDGVASIGDKLSKRGHGLQRPMAFLDKTRYQIRATAAHETARKQPHGAFV